MIDKLAKHCIIFQDLPTFYNSEERPYGHTQTETGTTFG